MQEQRPTIAAGAAGLGRGAAPSRPKTAAVNLSRPPAARPGTVKTQLAAETLRLYAGDWASFQRYCAERRVTALPANPDLVASFLVSARGGRTVLARRLAAIDHQHRQRGLPPPGVDAGVRAAVAAGPPRQGPGSSRGISILIKRM